MPLTLIEKQKAVNYWQKTKTKQMFKTSETARPQIPMIVNFELRLLCPDTGSYTTEIPKKVFKYYKAKHN